MNKKAIISIIIGTIILFIWSAVSWMVLPLHGNSLKNIPEQAMEMDKLKNLMPESGVYHYPGMPEGNSEEEMKAVEDYLAVGPRITLMVYKNGPTKFFDPKDFIFSLILNFLTAFLTFFVISKLGSKDLKSILLATMAIALLVIVIADLSLMNWFMFPWDYTFANILDRIVAFGLLGLLFGYYTFNPGDVEGN